MRPHGPVVPGNRWDLLAGDAHPRPHRPPRVSVVVTHYEQPRELARTLDALAHQTHPADLLEVVVADDGSSVAPSVPAGVRLVRQRHDGFGAARARNLGADAAAGDVLVFLDSDTAPEPSFVTALTRLPALAPEAVVVGRRRHVDPGSRQELPEPAWLTEGYHRTRDLLDADETSFRFVISAALACSRWMFELTGGFDETFTQYGGEDWEWAHRAWTHGALLAHEPRAVAWHEGPDRGARDTEGSEAAARRRLLHETVAVGGRVPVPGVAPRGLLTASGDPVVTIDRRVVGDALVITLDSLLAALPRCRVVLDAPRRAHLPDDPRLVDDAAGHLGTSAARSAWRHLHVDAPVTGDPPAWTAGGELLAGAGAPGLVDVLDPAGQRVLRWSSLRAERRAERWDDVTLDPRHELTCADLRAVDPATTAQAWWGGWA